MSIKVEPFEGDKWKLVLSGEPAYIYPLQMAPKAIEPLLSTGVWLIVTFPVWSVPVRYSVGAAINCAKHYSGKFNLGIRPYDYHDELKSWWPTANIPAAGQMILTEKDMSSRREVHITTDISADPAWLVLDEGEIVYQGGGPRSSEQLIELMQGVVK